MIGSGSEYPDQEELENNDCKIHFVSDLQLSGDQTMRRGEVSCKTTPDDT